MAIQFTDFSRAPIQESPFDSLFENVLKGYQMARVPKQLQQEEESRALTNQQKKFANALQDLALKHKPREYQLSDALKEAQLKRLNNPQGNIEKAFAEQERIEKLYGADSPQAQITRNLIQNGLIGNNKGFKNSKSTLTNAIKTQNQNILVNVPKVNKLIDDIIGAPSPLNVPGYRNNAKAQHAALVKEAAEGYAKAKGWPNTNESIKAAEVILDRGTLESDDAYRIRLKRLQDTLNFNYHDANETLGNVGGDNADSSSGMITIRNKKTGETKQISIEEARKMGVPNV